MTDKPLSLEELAAALEDAAYRQKFHKMDFFEPYPKQQQFFDLGLMKRERALFAGNQLGKTYCGSYEMACHLTGDYPDGWLGRRFDRPIRAWAAGETSTLVRDVQQKYLCGEPGVEDAFGTGMIPKAAFVDRPSLARGVTDAYDTIQVRHKSGGISVLRFKSYEQGRAKFQGESLDVVWCDEEPPMDIYSEILTRTTATNGMVYCTFTPLKGRSGVVIRYLDEDSPERVSITMTIYDVPRFTDEERAARIAAYPAHEREARALGVPMMGEGRIFPLGQEAISEPMIEHIPAYWAKLWGVDFGIAHPFGAVLILWDKDNDVIHVHSAVRVSDQGPLQHAAAMKPIGESVPVAWPQDGTQRDKGSLEPLAKQYRAHGLKMLADHATWPDGSVSTEAGIAEMLERMQTGRLKVAAHLSDWFEEFNLYHRKDGQIVKVKDDLLSATRIAIMMKRYAKPVALGGGGGPGQWRSGQAVARDVDFDLF